MSVQMAVTCRSMSQFREVSPFLMIKRSITFLKPPPDYSHVEFPERVKLRQVEKVPTYPSGIQPPKMMKNLKFIRGPELIHNKLIHEQYGIVAINGGRIKFNHFELLRNHLTRKLDYRRMFAVWRVDRSKTCSRRMPSRPNRFLCQA